MCLVAVCCARYKTRPGLTYHYNHTHKGRIDADPYTGFQVDSGSPPPRNCVSNPDSDSVAFWKEFGFIWIQILKYTFLRLFILDRLHSRKTTAIYKPTQVKAGAEISKNDKMTV